MLSGLDHECKAFPADAITPDNFAGRVTTDYYLISFYRDIADALGRSGHDALARAVHAFYERSRDTFAVRGAPYETFW